MKTIFEFDLPEEKSEFFNSLLGGSYLQIIDDMDEFLRRRIKYDDHLPEEAIKAYEDCRQHLAGLLDDRLDDWRG